MAFVRGLLARRREAKQARLANAKHHRDLWKSQYKDLFAEMSAAFFEIDPVGVNFDTNSDEYEFEVGSVLPRLMYAGSVSDVDEILKDEFSFWFDRFSFDRARVSGLAERVWDIWLAHGRPGGDSAPDGRDIDRH